MHETIKSAEYICSMTDAFYVTNEENIPNIKVVQYTSYIIRLDLFHV